MTPASLDAVAHVVAYVVAIAVLVNLVDDAFIDLRYILRSRRRRSITVAELGDVPQKRIAIMVPAWEESEVIAEMLTHTVTAANHDAARLDIFCGTYRNDPATQACVDEVARRHPNVHKVVVPHDGPTSKADCLNWIYQGIVVEEQRRNIRFDILVMHDAEDVVHPFEARLFSLLVPRYDFVQTPVFPLPTAPLDLTSGTYLDEFSEHHIKELTVREDMGGIVPSAGVGSAFAREAFEEIAADHGQQPFNPDSLTEDYDIGVRLRLAGKRSHFALYAISSAAGRRIRRSPSVDGYDDYIATRCYFPDRAKASVRQRARWITGIALQAWEAIGWKGPAAVRYCLWRDRKGVLMNGVLALAYALLAYGVVRWAMARFLGVPWSWANVVPPGSTLALLLLANFAGCLWRAGFKMHFATRVGGFAQGLASVPRLVFGNLLLIAATARAVHAYARHRLTGAPLRWNKTAHVFPSADVLRAQARRFGELLRDRGDVGAADLEHALAVQPRVGLRLGEILVAWGFLPRWRSVERLAEHLGVAAEMPDPTTIPLELLRRVPEALADELDALPLGPGRGGTVRVAFTTLPAQRDAERLAAALGVGAVDPVLAVPAAIHAARSVAYRRAADVAPSRVRLGDALVARGALHPEDLRNALEIQAETGEKLGEILQRSKLVDPRVLSEAAATMTLFGSIAAREGDADAMARVGYGYCALHEIVPLKRWTATSTGERARVVGAASPVHPATRAAVAHRLGEPVEFMLAPRVDVRVATQIARRNDRRSVAALDGEELAELAHRGIASLDIAASARGAGMTPLELLEASGAVEPREAAVVRAATLRVPLRVPPPGVDDGLLPPVLRRGGICVLEAVSGGFVLGCPRPTAALARQAAELLPGWEITWCVVPAVRPQKMEVRHAA